MRKQVTQARRETPNTASQKPPGPGEGGRPPQSSPPSLAGMHGHGPGGHNKLEKQAQGLNRLELAYNPAGPHWFVYEPRTGRTLATYEVASPARHDLENLGFQLVRGTRLSEVWVKGGSDV